MLVVPENRNQQRLMVLMAVRTGSGPPASGNRNRKRGVILNFAARRVAYLGLVGLFPFFYPGFSWPGDLRLDMCCVSCVRGLRVILDCKEEVVYIFRTVYRA